MQHQLPLDDIVLCFSALAVFDDRLAGLPVDVYEVSDVMDGLLDHLAVFVALRGDQFKLDLPLQI